MRKLELGDMFSMNNGCTYIVLDILQNGYAWVVRVYPNLDNPYMAMDRVLDTQWNEKRILVGA